MLFLHEIFFDYTYPSMSDPWWTLYALNQSLYSFLIENVIVGGVQVVATALAAILIDRLGQ